MVMQNWKLSLKCSFFSHKASFVHKEACILKRATFTFVKVDKSKESESHICWANRGSKCDTGLIVGFQPVKVRE